jgi:CRP/FNR family transcriptional regulator
MTPSLEPPPERTRASAAPCPAQPRVDRRSGTAQDLLGLLGAPGNDPGRGRAICVQFRRLPARATLFHESTPAEAIHVVRSGTFKCSRTDADGGERVLGFARRGDVLGYGALGLGRHTSAAVALEPSSVAVVPVAELFAWLQRLPALERALHQALSLQHASAEELSDVHALVPAEVRLARFLLHWSHRMAISGQSVRQLKLAMSRRDIARLLGVAHETVSRSFGSLAASGCVAVNGRTVDILDAAALQGAARSPVALQPLAHGGAEGARLHRIPALP